MINKDKRKLDGEKGPEKEAYLAKNYLMTGLI